MMGNLALGPRRAMTLGTAIALCAGLDACKAPPESRYVSDPADARHGLEVIERVGCGACHEIPGVGWPEGNAGPSLRGFDDFGPIAGQLPNTPTNLAAFVRNAPLAKPGSPMPAMPLSVAEARDVAAYLHGLDDG
ncbi:c-type cytochrome [Allopontixanthobacter sediminis]|nr:c-type cytochrome [Allopontixanthobacter sediminis]